MLNLLYLEAFWIGDQNDIPNTNPMWCEVWLRVENDQYDAVNDSFALCCKELKIQCDNKRINFPERMIKLVFANAVQLGDLIGSTPFISEIRRAQELTSFFDELPNVEQKEWIDDLLARTEFVDSNATVCVLDTGISTGHPLLVNAVDDEMVQSVEPSWGNHDHSGHGTEMAGIALYYDLKAKFLFPYHSEIRHRIESVKILPPKGENDPKLYGSITQNAIYLAEIANPNADRTTCMAITSEKYNTGDGRPTSWSGAIDNITSGAFGESKRLFFISAGNVNLSEIKETNYPNANTLHSVESPGQAWNAITVGAYSDLTQISDPLLKDYTAVADNGQLSPYSSTSLMWSAKWPIKPEILCNGGNIASDGENYTECSDFSILTTHYKPLERLLTTTWGTSSATAQASHLAANIMAEYPGIWPETVRALIVHSARWTDAMKAQFCVQDEKNQGRRNLLRTCGYGIPNLETAIQCMQNNVNLVIEGDLQPYVKGSMKDMHIHKIPWPNEILESLGDAKAVMRVTLSYFIEPGPGEIGWKDKYRYQSCGLRFDVINQNESREDFIKRINAKMREDKDDRGEGTSGSEHWYLGSKNRDVGSIHSDFREQNAVDLCDANYLAVYPVIGWWRERAHLKCYNKRIRYSLIVSITTPETNADLYTPIISKIKVSNQIEIKI